MATVRVAVVGASGETGSIIVDTLLKWEEPKFEILALTRPASVEKTVNQALKSRGVQIIPIELSASHDALVEVLSGVEVVISVLAAIGTNLSDQNRLADAAKAAGVKRFVPTSWGIAAPKGVMHVRDEKARAIEHVMQLGLPYTVIDVGWWYQMSVPQLPSGKTNYARPFGGFGDDGIPADGNVPSAMTDSAQIGEWTARIISDHQTINKMVFCYDEVLTPSERLEIAERLSGEKIPREYISGEDLKSRIAAAQKKIDEGEKDFSVYATRSMLELRLSWGVRGDNTPENAESLGYVLGRNLYPDMKTNTFEGFLKEVLAGNAKLVYQNR